MNTKAQGIFNSIIVAWLFCLTINVSHSKPEKVIVNRYIYKTDTIYIEEEIRFDTMQANIRNMYKVCDSLGIKYPRIVISQAILESGNFSSELFRRNNNPLGLYDSRNRRYYKFNHWSEAISAYQNMVEYKHRSGEDYYDFLSRIGYAEAADYIEAVKRIEKTLPP